MARLRMSDEDYDVIMDSMPQSKRNKVLEESILPEYEKPKRRGRIKRILKWIIRMYGWIIFWIGAFLVQIGIWLRKVGAKDEDL